MLKKLEKINTGVLKHICSVEGEWTCDGEFLDFAVTFNKDFFTENGIEVESDFDGFSALGGHFYFEEGINWFWAIAHRRITEKSKNRKHLGPFDLYDSETGRRMPNTKLVKELKKALIPYLEEEMQSMLKEV